MVMATSLKDYLKKYQSTGDVEQKPKSKTKKKRKGGAAAAKVVPSGVVIVDNDSGWQKNIDEDSDDADLEDGVDGPQVIEDVEVKRMHQMERLKQHRPYMSIGDDGSGWVPVTEHTRDSSPPRRRRNDSPEDQGLNWRSEVELEDLSPPRKKVGSPDPASLRKHLGLNRSVKVEDDDISPPRRNARRPDLSPDRKHKHASDLSPPRRSRGSLDLSPPRKNGGGKLGLDLSPPRRGTGRSDLSPPRRDSHNAVSLPPRRGQRNQDLSPAGRTGGDGSSPSGLDNRRKPHRSDDASKRRGSEQGRRSGSADQSPPRRKQPRLDSPGSSPPRRKQPRLGSPDSSPPRRKQPRLASPDVSPARRNASDRSLDAINKKAKMTDGRQAGLTSGNALASDLAKKKRDEAKRMKEMEPSVTGRGAETIYRDKRGKRLEGLEELLRQQQGEAKPEVKPLEWGKGLAQKRDIEKQQAEYDAEKNKPFARSRDDPELEKMMKDRLRWGDPMAHLVKSKDPEAMLVDLGASQEMKESGFIVPQDVPKHSWLKRGVGAPMNRYGIKPGRHWDGVDRSTGFESQMFKAKAEKQANEMEAYMWSVADM